MTKKEGREVVKILDEISTDVESIMRDMRGIEDDMRNVTKRLELLAFTFEDEEIDGQE